MITNDHAVVRSLLDVHSSGDGYATTDTTLGSLDLNSVLKFKNPGILLPALHALL